jgi:hypothetical protein
MDKKNVPVGAAIAIIIFFIGGLWGFYYTITAPIYGDWMRGFYGLGCMFVFVWLIKNTGE